MRYEELVYPPYEAPLVDAYDHRFESVYIVLHPFVRMPEDLGWRVTQQYPSVEQIVAEGTKCCWSEVIAQTGLANFAKTNHALLTSSGSLVDYLCDFPARDAVHALVQSGSVWMPEAGRFEPLLRKDFLAAFEAAGHHELVFVPEFPQADPIERLPIAALKDRSHEFPSRGSLVAPDASFLFTVDWDSFFTLFYGPQAFVESVVRERNLEGFYATALTEHNWFNYTMGCATVTVGP